jgi:hypothetical protein
MLRLLVCWYPESLYSPHKKNLGLAFTVCISYSKRLVDTVRSQFLPLPSSIKFKFLKTIIATGREDRSHTIGG